MSKHSTPSFDHLQSTGQHEEHDRYNGVLVEAQIRRNGQMKYQRMTQASGPVNEEVVMPDGEIMPPAGGLSIAAWRISPKRAAECVHGAHGASLTTPIHPSNQ